MRKNSKSIRVQVVSRTDLIKNNIECRVDDAQAALATYLGLGYAIYDVVAQAGFNNLGTIAAGKYVCVWKGARAASYTLPLYTAFTRHTDVVIMGIEINTMNQVIGIVTNTFIVQAGDYAGFLTFWGGYNYFPTCTGVKNIGFNTTICYINSSAVDIENPVLNTCQFHLSKNLTFIYSAYKQILNSQIICDVSDPAAVVFEVDINADSTSPWMSGVQLENFTGLSLFNLKASQNRVFNFQSVFLKNSNINITALTTTTNSVFYYNSPNVSLSVGSTGYLWNVAGVKAFTTGTADSIQMKVNSSGVVIVAFKDGNQGGKLSVKQFVNGAWSDVGSPGISAGTADHIALSLINNEIYVAYSDGANSGKATVSRWDGTAWSIAGNAAFTPGTASYIQMVWFQPYGLGRPGLQKPLSGYIMFSDGANGNKLSIWNCTSPTGTWAALYTGVTSGAITQLYGWYGGGTNPNDSSYVAYDAYYINASGYLTRRQYSTQMGNSFDTETVLIPSVQVNYLSVNYVNGRAAFYTYTKTSSGKASLKSYDGTTDSLIGTEDFSPGSASFNRVFSGANIYLAFSDGANSGKLSVYWKNGNALELYGTAGFTDGAVSAISITENNGVPFIAFQDVGNSSKLSVYKYDNPSVVTNINFQFKLYQSSILSGKDSLNLTLIRTLTNYLTQGVIITPIMNIVNVVGAGGTIRNDYQFGFRNTVYDVLKNTGTQDFWIVKMDEAESLLVGKIIRNLSLLNQDLTTFLYSNNDNFFILATSPSKGTAVIMYYNKTLYKSRYSDCYLNEVYTITDCVQILEPKTYDSLVNTLPGYPNGPMDSGTITFNNYDNEVIV
jgi:hypothetical protein